MYLFFYCPHICPSFHLVFRAVLTCSGLKYFLLKHTLQVKCDCIPVSHVHFNIILFIWNSSTPPPQTLSDVSLSFPLDLNWRVILHLSRRRSSNANCGWWTVFFKDYLAVIVIKYALKLNHNGFLLCELFSRTGEQSYKSDELLPLIFVKQFDQKCNIGSGRRWSVFSYTSPPKGLFSLALLRLTKAMSGW